MSWESGLTSSGMTGRCERIKRGTNGSGSMARRGYAPDMRGLVPWVGAIIVLVALWPTVCMSAEGGPATAC